MDKLERLTKKIEYIENIDFYYDLLSYSLTDLNKNYSEGELLKELRTYLEIPQKDIAKKLFISAPTLSRHESRKKVNPTTLKEYVEQLGISLFMFDSLKLLLSLLNENLSEFLDDNDVIEKLKKIATDTRIEEKECYIENINDILNFLYVDEVKKISDYANMVLIYHNHIEKINKE